MVKRKDSSIIPIIEESVLYQPIHSLSVRGREADPSIFTNPENSSVVVTH